MTTILTDFHLIKAISIERLWIEERIFLLQIIITDDMPEASIRKVSGWQRSLPLDIISTPNGMEPGLQT